MPTAFTRAKRALVGQPLPSDRLENERLNKRTALAVLSSDAISSVAYATDQILFVLGGAIGAAAVAYVVPISAVIVGLLVLVGLSYRQTVFAYPNGGGSYTVARENLGTGSGLVAAAALLTDYILTVAVSISSGVAAITSAYPALVPHAVLLCLLSILVLGVVNLRGVRDSGAAFSVPTYVFIAAMCLLIGTGLYRLATGHELAPLAAPLKVDPTTAAPAHPLSPVTGLALGYLLVRGFAEGCAAMTGTEAISNGVMAFRNPAQKNAATTLGWMVGILAAFFLGVSFLAQHYRVMPTTDQTVLSILGRHVFGGGFFYYLLQYSTFAVLVLAANTAFADFPRLGSILAHDQYLPRRLAARGDRLAFSNGIILLSAVAALLVFLFKGDTNALVPLYALGVFVCFTLSQAGMVQHWRKTREPGWRWRAALNGLGAGATGVVAVIEIVTKFTSGGWIVVVLIPLIIWMLVGIHRYYTTFTREIAFTGRVPRPALRHTVVVAVGGVTKPSAGALVYATTIAPPERVRAAYVTVDADAAESLRAWWPAWGTGVGLVVLPSPFRSVVRPLVQYVKALLAQAPGAAEPEADLVTVVVPEVIPSQWWENLLHNQTALFLKAGFLFRSDVVVTSVPYQMGRAGRLRDVLARESELDVEHAGGNGVGSGAAAGTVPVAAAPAAAPAR
ncbi:amino acid permease [Gemmatimonadetes bacterium T265]|nr:amino acid permease [Gemmatimonadetes bacterium T265]